MTLFVLKQNICNVYFIDNDGMFLYQLKLIEVTLENILELSQGKMTIAMSISENYNSRG